MPYSPNVVDDQLQAMDALIDRVDQLHSSPQVACKILDLIEDPNFSIHDVVECLEHDPALAASILRLVNSAHFGLSNRVTSLQHAVTYIGRRSLRLAVLSFGLVDHLMKGTPAEMYHAFWQRSFTMAAAASRLAAVSGEVNQDEAYTAGLFVDLGVLLFAQLETTTYPLIYKEQPHGSDLARAEERQFGFDHAALGARLLSRWNFPDILVEAAALHHEEGSGDHVLISIVQAADLVADALWVPKSPQLPRAKAIVERRFGLDLDGFITLAVDCQEIISESEKIFGVRLPGSINFIELLQKARHLYLEQGLEDSLELDNLATLADNPLS